MRLRVALLLLAALAAALPARALPPSMLKLTQVGTTFDQPVAFAARAGDERLFVAEKTGRVKTLTGATILDLSAEVSDGQEQGLLGLTFSPDGSALYVYFTDKVGKGRARLTSFLMSGTTVNLSSRRDMLAVERIYSKHYSGALAFGLDGHLYIASGDGGDWANGQRLGNLLGKILRIDPRPTSTTWPYFVVPPTNPFVNTPGARPEIWSFGLRNPWRFSFDRLNGDIWIGDVGETAWEEINHRPASSTGGENYGWSQMEGDFSFNGGIPPANHVRPVYEYSHQGSPLGIFPAGCAITGGYVYRGSRIPDLQGYYLYADFCQSRVWGLTTVADTSGWTFDFGTQSSMIVSFGEDTFGELYVLSIEGTVFRIDPA